jgi:murein DD-endopeptidase MepM/ murein hydrolase activator NlpD
MHLGDDFVGTRGDPVYAPFDLVVERVGEYTDPGRLGKNIQARFADGTLYYAGHLVDVYVSAGQQVPACTVIATLGATDGPHTHIKLASLGAPIPCEGSPPGPGGCIDPIDYWNTH